MKDDPKIFGCPVVFLNGGQEKNRRRQAHFVKCVDQFEKFGAGTIRAVGFGANKEEALANVRAVVDNLISEAIAAEREACAMRWEAAHGFDKNGVAEWLRSNPSEGRAK